VSLLRKRMEFEKDGVGRIGMVVIRKPFRLFGDGLRIFFRPALDSAAWHEVDIRRVDIMELMDCGSAFAAMAYLRSAEKN
jgi:hypothetical protein